MMYGDDYTEYIYESVCKLRDDLASVRGLVTGNVLNSTSLINDPQLYERFKTERDKTEITQESYEKIIGAAIEICKFIEWGNPAVFDLFEAFGISKKNTEELLSSYEYRLVDKNGIKKGSEEYADRMRDANELFGTTESIIYASKEKFDYFVQMKKFYANIKSNFIKNMIIIFLNNHEELNGNPELFKYYLNPILLSGAFEGDKFVRFALLYEGVMMRCCNNYHYNFIKFRIMQILGFDVTY